MRQSTSAPSVRARGLSFIELVTMIAIIAVLAIIAGPRYANSLALYRAQQAAQRVVADVNLARWQAKASSAGQSIVFSMNSNSYNLPGVAGLGGQGSVYTVNLSAEPYRATLVSTTLASSQISFDYFGQPSGGGTIVVQSGNATKSITIDAVTGAAVVQ